MTTRSAGPAGALHAALAVLLPALLLGLALCLATRGDDAALSPGVQAVETALREANPQVVLLGASTIAEAVDPRILGQELDPASPVRVASLARGATMPPVWYVLARERLYGSGIEPRLLVVGTTPKWLLENAVSTQGAQTVMADNLTRYDPIVAEKAYGQKRQNPVVERIGRARAQARAAFQALVREWSVGLAFGEGEGGLAERGRRVAEPALAQVFGTEGAVDMALQRRVIPVVEVPDEVREARGRATSVAESFVPDLISLAQAHGSRIVFVWIPVPDFVERDQILSPALHADLVRSLNAAGAGWVDLHDLDYGDELFRDLQHMNVRGRARFSRDLAAALLRIDALGDGPLPSAPVPFYLGHSVRREGEPASLGPLTFLPLKPGARRLEAVQPDRSAWSNLGTRTAGLGPVSPLVVLEDGEPLETDHWGRPEPEPGTACHFSRLLTVAPRDPEFLAEPGEHFSLGLSEDLPVRVAGFEGWWAYPGTALVLSIDGAAEAGLPAKLTVVLEAFGAGEGGPVVTAAGQPVALAPRAEALVGEAPLALPARTWEVRIDVPAAGPMVAVRWVAIEADGQRIDLMGREAFVLPPSVNLLQRARQGEATVRSALQPVALGAFAPHPELPVGILQAPDLEPLSNGALVSQIRCPTCSPLRLREDGALLLPSSASCRSMMRERSQAGRFCQEGAELRAVGLDGGNPGRTGRAWTVEVVPSRLPPIGFWIAPGDVTDLPSPGWMLLPMRHGARTLLLGGVAVGGDPAAVLDLTLELGGEAAATLRIPAAGLRGTPVELAVDPPLPAGARPLVLRVASPGDAPFVLLTKAELRE